MIAWRGSQKFALCFVIWRNFSRVESIYPSTSILQLKELCIFEMVTVKITDWLRSRKKYLSSSVFTLYPILVNHDSWEFLLSGWKIVANNRSKGRAHSQQWRWRTRYYFWGESQRKTWSTCILWEGAKVSMSCGLLVVNHGNMRPGHVFKLRFLYTLVIVWLVQ